MEVGDICYYARIVPGILYQCLELKIRTYEDNWFVGVEKMDKQAYLIGTDKIGSIVFSDRFQCLRVLKRAEKEYGIISEDG